MKKLLTLAAVALIGLVILTIGALLAIDSIARRGVAAAGTYALGVSTTLEGADVGVLSGEFSMSGLNVANPEGFDSPHFLHLDEGGVAVSLGSLRKQIVELPSLTLSGVDVNLQRTGGSSNYSVILGNLGRFESGASTSNKKPAKQTAKQTGKQGKRFIVKVIDIRDVAVHVDLLPVGGDLTSVDVPIKQIRLTNVGSDTGQGVLLSELAGVVIKAVLAAAADKGKGVIPADILGDLTSGLGQLQSLGDMGVGVLAAGAGGDLKKLAGAGVGAVAEQAQRQVKDVEQQLKDKAGAAGQTIKKGIGKGLGGLLGDKKKKKKKGGG